MLTKPHRVLGWIIFLLGAVGLAAALVLTVEYLHIAADEDYVASCDVNAVLSCGSVMRSNSSAVIGGIPNSLFGVAGFAAVTAIGAALAAGAVFAGWFWFLIQVGVTVALIFVHWMFYDSVFVFGLLCPYCMVVWAVTIPLFVLVTSETVRSYGGSTVLYRWRWLIILVWVAVIAAVVISRNYEYLF